MRLLMIGDIVGRPGRKAVKETLPGLKKELQVDVVVANGENAAGGTGITQDVANELFNAGIDILTMGNHVWDKKDVFTFIDKEKRIVRPANYPEGTPGLGYTVCGVQNTKIIIINISGLVFMPNLRCPFRTVAEILEEAKDITPNIFVDFHAEATSEKIALAWYLNGRVTAVCGTHTHVQTADETILPDGTAYITDIGMTGPKNSVLGVKTDLVLQKFLTQMPVRFEVADGPYQFNAVVIEFDELSGKARNIERIFNIEG
ncbi:TIGR00282 family metallophosphoesterase [Thermincola potens]|uniref:Metallophosphoesterase n=1 Tax=Thermincola potens (strain JR) TaxID=635013 RepID=D5XES2_THEPJ|nr:TIGR00282 family metallophosphoesterase [Thermincola potens]ADG82143.1 metallophosphoesterase [Thermincola potens JR]